MIKALDSSRQAMQMQWRRHEVISNNLANVNTPGFKREMARVSAHLKDGVQAPGQELFLPQREILVEGVPSKQGGPLLPTGNPLDIALTGEGFFQVETDQGLRLTRDGSFRLDEQGVLVHSSGGRVLVDGSPIHVGENPSILPDGSVLDGEILLGRLSILLPEEGARLERQGDNLLRLEGGSREAEESDYLLAPGFLEGSNVQSVREMVDMIRAYRAYEMAQRGALAADETLRIATQRVGSLRP
ncbi:MAG: flagellar hook-basal body protein [Candidatus Krumholzibacteria bacterium]|nr:flagellar hook-basal body protein [Candidatus Krumholzibacteria bacterium]MDP6669042.1 flagellar hook-basal body protein [Candidatus Krumholzibacteria bacterium]MDP6797456.1 flagellar hook-basal body protein [Candidatus Krumholzibacteria bacterium]MDP7020981.1 flagellar hook-basal body protein [Candidatus Krumholzibacteria bacterium]